MQKFDELKVPYQWEEYYTRTPKGYSTLETIINWVGQVNSMTQVLNNLLETGIPEYTPPGGSTGEGDLSIEQFKVLLDDALMTGGLGSIEQLSAMLYSAVEVTSSSLRTAMDEYVSYTPYSSFDDFIGQVSTLQENLTNVNEVELVNIKERLDALEL